MRTGRILAAVLALAVPALAIGASRAPLVLNGPQTQQLQSSDSLKLPNVTGSVQCLHTDSTGAVTGTGADCGSGAGTVTNIATGAGLTGGPITTTGTISLATIADGDVLANVSGATAAPAATTINALLDHVFGATQGSVIYRGASGWNELTPGTSGYFLQTQGASANPQWAAAGCTFANPTATASDAAVNGAATTCMRSDAAPAVQLGSASQFGIVKVDGVTITATGGVISAGPDIPTTAVWRLDTGGTTQTDTNNFAAHGNVFTPDHAITVYAVAFQVNTVTSATYKVCAALWSWATSKITTAPVCSNTWTATTGNVKQDVSGTLSTPLVVSQDTAFATYMVRTDATGTASSSNYDTNTSPGKPEPAFWTQNQSAAGPSAALDLASTSPTTSDTWTVTQSGSSPIWHVENVIYGID